MGEGWRLEDGEAMAARHPETFRIAPLETRAGLQPGDYAKLMIDFEDEAGRTVTERMWTVVLKAHEGHYLGRLVNVPAARPRDVRLAFGSELRFEPRHVINWEEADARSRAFVADPAKEF